MKGSQCRLHNIALASIAPEDLCWELHAASRYITPPGQGFLPNETAVHHQVQNRSETCPVAQSQAESCEIRLKHCSNFDVVAPGAHYPAGAAGAERCSPGTGKH